MYTYSTFMYMLGIAWGDQLGQFARIDPITLVCHPSTKGVSSRIADYQMADVRLQQVMQPCGRSSFLKEVAVRSAAMFCGGCS